MQNIHEILRAYGLSVPDDKKAEFDKAVTENYKTVAEVEKINEKLTKANTELKETKETLETTNAEFEQLKNSNASKDDWEKKYNDLVAENTKQIWGTYWGRGSFVTFVVSKLYKFCSVPNLFQYVQLFKISINSFSKFTLFIL